MTYLYYLKSKPVFSKKTYIPTFFKLVKKVFCCPSIGKVKVAIKVRFQVEFERNIKTGSFREVSS